MTGASKGSCRDGRLDGHRPGNWLAAALKSRVRHGAPVAGVSRPYRHVEENPGRLFKTQLVRYN